MKNNQYSIEESKNKPGYWVCSDYINKVVCIFEDGNFNDNQNMEYLEDNVNITLLELSRIVREMADWLRENHYDKIFYNIRLKFGQNLKKIRNKKGLTVRGLAELSGLSKSTIENIEQGRFSCSLDVLYNISIGLDVPIRDLFDF
jgi:DNA-binding XRE family transcriptional regulator